MDLEEDQVQDNDDKIDSDEHDGATPLALYSITKRQSIFIWLTQERSINHTTFVLNEIIFNI